MLCVSGLIGGRRGLAVLLACGSFAGVSAPMASAAGHGDLIESLHVAVGQPAVTRGTETLHAGTRYTLSVDGTATRTSP